MKLLTRSILAVTIAFTANPANALLDRMPAPVRASIFRQVCTTYKYHGLTIKAHLERTRDLYLSNANFEPLPDNLSASEIESATHERRLFALDQAGEILKEAVVDKNCQPAR